MLRNFTIFLLLVSFQANAIAGALMMSDMMASSMSSEKHTAMMHDGPNLHPMGNDRKATDHCSSSMEMQQSVTCDPLKNSKDGCDKSSDCGLCSGHYFKAVLIHNFVIPPACQFDFESDYKFSGDSVTHPLNLKPPKTPLN